MYDRKIKTLLCPHTHTYYGNFVCLVFFGLFVYIGVFFIKKIVWAPVSYPVDKASVQVPVKRSVTMSSVGRH